MSSRSYDESIESIDRRIEQLRARRRDEVARRERSERRAESAACMAYGRALVAWAGGDWKAIDPVALDAFLRRLSGYGSRVRRQETVSTQEALRAIRALETEVARREDDGGDGETVDDGECEWPRASSLTSSGV